MQKKSSKEFGEFIPIRHDVISYAGEEVVRIITTAPDGAAGATFYGEPDEFDTQTLPDVVSS